MFPVMEIVDSPAFIEAPGLMVILPARDMLLKKPALSVPLSDISPLNKVGGVKERRPVESWPMPLMMNGLVIVSEGVP